MLPLSQPPVEYRDVPGFPGYRVGTDGSVWSCWERTAGGRSPDDLADAFALEAAGAGQVPPERWVAPVRLRHRQPAPILALRAGARAGIFGIGERREPRFPFG
jgi:hypothetical protein